nr:mitogen-activated protein kinase kinase kinase 2-like [Ipomoea batatas]
MACQKFQILGAGSYGTVFLGRLSSYSSIDPPVFAVKSSKLESSRSLRVEGRILNQFRGCPYIVHCFGDDTSLEHEEVVYNLLLECGCGVNHLKIADFGLAKPSGVNIFGNCHPGSLLYTSPESLVSGMHEAPKDIWAIGCMVVEMITGNPTWRFRSGNSKDASLNNAFLNIAFNKPEIPEGISNNCKDFLEMCFARNPSTRWTAPMLLNHPFVANEFNLRLGKKLEDHHQVNSPFGFEGWCSTTCLFSTRIRACSSRPSASNQPALFHQKMKTVILGH